MFVAGLREDFLSSPWSNAAAPVIIEVAEKLPRH